MVKATVVRQERSAVHDLDRVNRDDVGMVECGDGARLALEAIAAFRVDLGEIGEDLVSDEPIEPRVAGSVYLCHSP